MNRKDIIEFYSDKNNCLENGVRRRSTLYCAYWRGYDGIPHNYIQHSATWLAYRQGIKQREKEKKEKHEKCLRYAQSLSARMRR